MKHWRLIALCVVVLCVWSIEDVASHPLSSESPYDAMIQVPSWHCLRYFRTLVRKCRIFKPGIRRA